MDLIKELESQQMKAEKPVANVGDTVRVHVKIKEGSRERIQVFEGIVIAKKHGGIEETITVRRLAVSYTHLDVYKRQGRFLAADPARAGARFARRGGGRVPRVRCDREPSRGGADLQAAGLARADAHWRRGGGDAR